MKKSILLASAAVFALSATGAMATSVPVQQQTVHANIDLVSVIAIQEQAPLNFGKFISVPGQEITLRSYYNSDNSYEFVTDLYGSGTVEIGQNNETFSSVQLATATPGILKLSATGMDFTHTESLENPAPNYLVSLFTFQFTDIPMFGPNGEDCGTVVPSIDTEMYTYNDIENPAGYSIDYSTYYVGGTFTQGDEHIHGHCSGQGTVTLILSDR